MTDAVRPGCEPVLADISAYLDGELGAPACERIEHHCQTCASCAAVVQGLRDTIGLCHEAAVAALPDDVRRKAQASIAALLDQRS